MDKVLITVIRDISELESIRPVWEKLQYHPNSDIDFYLTILKSRKNVIRPHILLLKINDTIKSIVVGRVEDINMDFSFGYKSIYTPKTRALTILYGGFLGEFNCDIYKLVVSEFINTLQKKEVNIVTIGGINNTSSLYDIALTEPKWYLRDYIYKIIPHYSIELPSEAEAFYSKLSAKHRYWIKRMAKSLEKDFNGNIKYILYTKKEQLDILIDSAESISKNTYQRGLGVGFVNNDEIYNRLCLSAEKGWLCAFVLYVGDSPSAFWIGTHYKNVFHLNYTGYKPVFQKYEVGTLVLLKIFEYCIQNGISKVDFGFGDAFYKKRFGDNVCNEATINIYSNRLSSIKINIANIIISGSANIVQYFMKKYNIESKIKKLWRKRLRNSGST